MWKFKNKINPIEEQFVNEIIKLFTSFSQCLKKEVNEVRHPNQRVSF